MPDPAPPPRPRAPWWLVTMLGISIIAATTAMGAILARYGQSPWFSVLLFSGFESGITLGAILEICLRGRR